MHLKSSLKVLKVKENKKKKEKGKPQFEYSALAFSIRVVAECPLFWPTKKRSTLARIFYILDCLFLFKLNKK